MSNYKFNVKLVKYMILSVLLLSWPLPLNSSSLSGSNLDSGQSEPTDSSQQFFRRMDESFAHEQVINRVLNINDSNTDGILNNFNVSKDEILRRISALQPNSSRSMIGERNLDSDIITRIPNEPAKSDVEKQEIYIDAFKKRIESMVERNASRHTPDWSTAAIHDMAFYPLCSKNNQTSWLEENTAKLYFSSSIFDKLIPNTFLHRAILRLRQKIPENLGDTDANVAELDSQNGCPDVDEIIHVKVSIFIKRSVRGGNNRIGNSANYGSNRRESKPVLKKLVCHSFTLNRQNRDWVEIDVRQVIKYWEKMYRASVIHNKGGAVADPMVAIDVEDEYQQPLKAGLFFEPTDCQASPAIPWSLYGENVRTLFGAQVLPNNPRLDIKWSQMHRPHRHYGHRSHRLHNTNHLDNLRLLNESRLISSILAPDHSDLNLISNANNRNHQKNHNIDTETTNVDSYRVKRSQTNQTKILCVK